MIFTERQHRLTKERIEKFASTRRQLLASGKDDVLTSGQLAGVESILERMTNEIAEYELLKRGNVAELSVETFGDLPAALIRARVGRGLSQSALAELIGVKPQQIQRWEKDRYRTVALSRLVEIAAALRLNISERIELAGDGPVALTQVRRSLRQLGFSKEFVETRLMPRKQPLSNNASLQDELDARLVAIIGVRSRELVAGRFSLQQSQMFFKLPASAQQTRTRAYAHFSAALCAIVAKAMNVPNSEPFPSDFAAASSALFPEGSITLRAALEACWARGIGVIPLKDQVAFHGACWHRNGRTIIVIQQPSQEQSRWLLDLIHELYHDSQNGSREENFMMVEGEETSSARRKSLEERRAQRYAAEVVTSGRLEELTDRVASLAGNFGPRLKAATERVAIESRVPVGILANLMAWRLGESGTSWWGVAARLQPAEPEAWKEVRAKLLQSVNLDRLDRYEREFLMQCLETDDG